MVLTKNVTFVILRNAGGFLNACRPGAIVQIFRFYAAKQKHHPDGWCFVGGEGEIWTLAPRFMAAYALSRGASSASWVLLHTVAGRPSRVTRSIIIYKIFAFVKGFGGFFSKLRPGRMYYDFFTPDLCVSAKSHWLLQSKRVKYIGISIIIFRR